MKNSPQSAASANEFGQPTSWPRTDSYSTLFGGHDAGNGHIGSRRPHQWGHSSPHTSVVHSLTPVAGPIFETKNRAIFLERFFGRGITAREQLSRAKNSLDFK